MTADLFRLSVPWWEFVVRAAVVYVFLVGLLRLTGKRQVGQLAPFDLVLLLVLSNAVQNSMNAGDNSLAGGLILATTLVLLNWLVGLATFRSRKLEALLEGRPLVLIHHGQIRDEAMTSAKITPHELDGALRQAGVTCAEKVEVAILENNGAISVIPREGEGSAPGKTPEAGRPSP